MSIELALFDARTLQPDGQYASTTAVGIEAGRIAFMGPDQELRDRITPNTPAIHLAQRTLMPGFGDAHVHIWKLGQLKTMLLDLRGVKSIASMQEQLSAITKQSEPGTWIMARGFNEATLAEGRLPDHRDLDAISREHPIWVIRTCAHIAVANSLALQKAGITTQTPNPEGGVIERFEDGRPNGIMNETALPLVQAIIPKPTAAQRVEMIRKGAELLVRHGVTFACDPGVDEDLLAAYHELDRNGALPLRCNVMTLGSDAGNSPDTIPTPYASDFLRVDTVKFFLDGGLSGASAAISKPYRDSEETGVLRLTAKQFRQAAEPWVAAGYRVACHAIGDVAIEAALDAYAQLKPLAPDRRHRIEHVGLPRAKHLAIACELGVMVIPQAIFVHELGRAFRKYVPDNFGVTPYPLRSMLDAGLTLALSTDAPVVRELNPWAGIQAAILRQDLDGHIHDSAQSITLNEAIQAYTAGSAEVCGLAVGQLSVGMPADLIVLDRDPLSCAPEELSKIAVDLALIAGRTQYSRTDQETHQR